MSHQLKYRPHIDGLRAIAVVSVILFHLSADFLPGGFVGVDIFFVISGFLISRMIYTEALAGTFSIINFYEGRAYRILPAFLAVSGLTFVGVYFIFLPPEFENFAKSLLASLAFAPNIFFYVSTDYFAPSAETLPALHFWSLGVEEQFYFVFPLFVLAIMRTSPRTLPLCIAVLASFSLVAAEAAVRTNPPAAFYLLPFRAYELLIGSIIALPNVRCPQGTRTSEAASGVGLLLILASFFLLTKESRFPGVSALLPTVGTALVLWACDRTSNALALLLSLPAISFLGRISYSLYLVHWPLILFARRAFPYADAGITGALVFAISIMVAVCSYHFIEQPFRRRRLFWKKWQIFGLAGGAIVFLASISGLVLTHQGFPGRLDARLNEILAYRTYDYKQQFRARTCFLDPDQRGSEIDFAACLPTANPRKAILWGDSAVAQLYSGLRAPLNDKGYALGQLTASACAPVEGLEIEQRPNCLGFNDLTLPRILEEKPELLIMAASWHITDGLLDKLNATISKLNTAGIHPVILGAPISYKVGVPALLAERLRAGNHDPFSGRDLLTSYVTSTDDALRKSLNGRKEVTFVSIFETVCPTGQCPLIVDGKIPMHFDSMHLTLAGSRFFANALLPNILP